MPTRLDKIKTAAKRQAILTFLKRKDKASTVDIVQYMWDRYKYPDNCTRWLLYNLRDKCLVEKAGYKSCRSYGKDMVVWKLRDRGCEDGAIDETED